MFKERYERRKKEVLGNKSINSVNREIIKKFLKHEEYKLKRKNGLAEVDERSYKTLYFYVGKFENINKWFKNQSWNKLSLKEIKKVIDDLEDGNITNNKGKRYSDRAWYYQIMQGELFRLANKRDDIVREIIREFGIKGRNDNNEVRFIPESDFRKIVDCAISPEQRCLLWLEFDIGENIGTLIELEKDDFRRQINEDTKEPEYLVILRKDKLKRSRTARSELTNYQETVKFLDIVLGNLEDSKKVITNRSMKNKKLSEIHNKNKLFKFGHKSAEQFLKRCVEKSKVVCQPGGEKVTWKDLRSSMACDLLKKDWSREEVNARLGHRPSSRVIDKYINFLALDRHKPKKKIYEGNLNKLKEELEQSKESNKLQSMRMDSLKNEVGELKSKLEQTDNFKKLFESMMKRAIKNPNEFIISEDGEVLQKIDV
ncbi:MAG: hypothetical protein OQK82_08085 [Candidatus Pacearchaeota archaeon]|nr:hypothetical protein [Candidatus Pacearchaeota archaeon]